MGMHLGRLRALVIVWLPQAFLRHAKRFIHFATPGRLGLVALPLIGCAATLFFVPKIEASQFVRIDYNIYVPGRFRHTVFLELFDDRPITTTNFLQYVNSGKYDQSIMHRLATGFALQGGGYYPQFVDELHPTLASVPYSLNPAAVVDLDGNSGTSNPSIANEFALSPARLNARGTISMAQSPGNPNSASSQWFFNLANNTSLDVPVQGSGPYTVFGRVAGDGMNYMDSLISNLTILNMNPDANDDGVREAGPFYNGSGDGSPMFIVGGSLAALQLVNVDQIDYFGAGSSTVVDNTWSISARNAVIDTGALFSGDVSNPIVLGLNRSLQVREGYSLGRDLVSHGTVSPGLQLGTITTRNYVQNFDATLEIEIAGPTLDTQYDRVVSTETAFLSGKLDVSFLGGYSPGLNTTFNVVNANNITGAFTFYDLPNLAAGLVWKITKTTTAFTLKVVGGDYNRNGVVDAADYILWRKTRNTSVTAGTGADGNSDGLVNDSDYAVWRTNFGSVRGIGAGAGSGSLEAGNVPEPATVALMLCGGVSIAFLRRRQRP
jgi:cyclophilin family peptidyl-prolyl cis-trans isomerase